VVVRQVNWIVVAPKSIGLPCEAVGKGFDEPPDFAMVMGFAFA
jgi:hypothetical protein